MAVVFDFDLNQVLAAQNDYHFVTIPTNILSFLFCQGFSTEAQIFLAMQN